MRNVLTHYKRLWNLYNDGDTFTSYSGWLQPVLFDGQKCMLKIARREKDKRGNELMIWWNGDGAAKILMHDDTALLMERALGTKSLTGMAQTGQDDEASRILCDVIAQLHMHHDPYPAGLIPLTTWFNDLKLTAAKHEGIFAECSRIADYLLSDQRDVVALHGDIHHGNVLDFDGRGWLAIDPKGLIGERGFDYANIFCNPDTAMATAPGRLMRQVGVVSKQAGLEPKRLLQWIAAWAGLSVVWAMADNTSNEPALTVARTAVTQLNFINFDREV